MGRSPRRERHAFVLLLVLMLALTACSGSTSPASTTPKPKVVVTTPVLGDVVRNALGDQAEIEVLVPPAVDPRTHVVSAEQRQRVPDASVVVVNGLGADPELGNALLAVRARGHEVIEAATRLNPIPLPAFPAASGGVDGSAPTTATTIPPAAGSPLGTTPPSGAAALDPHVWLDADRMTHLARIVGDAVAPLPGVDRGDITRRIDAYADELAKADESIQAALLPLSDGQRALATERNELGYFAERYGLQVVTTLGGDGVDMTDAQRDAAATLMRTSSARVILTSSDPPPPSVTAVAAMTDAPRIVVLDVTTLGPPGSATDTEIKLLTALGQQLGRALSG